jgi:hypothetical protein
MTVNVTDITSGPYAGNDVADTFSYDFSVKIKTQLSVFETSPVGVVTPMVLDSDYTVTGVGVEGGGTVVRTAGPLPAGYQWFIVSNYNLSQLTDFESQGAFYPDVHEASFDKLTYLILQNARNTNLSLHLPHSYSGSASTQLPLPAAGKFLQWKSDLSGLQNVSIGEGAYVIPHQGKISDYLNDSLTNFQEALLNACIENVIVDFEGLTLSTDDAIVIPSNAKCRKWLLNGANLTFTDSQVVFNQLMYEIDGVGGFIRGGLKLAQLSEETAINTKILEVYQGHDFIVGDYMTNSLDNYGLPNATDRAGYIANGNDYNRIQSIVDNGDGTDTVTLTYNFLDPAISTMYTGLIKHGWMGNGTFNRTGLTFNVSANVVMKNLFLEHFQGYVWRLADGAGDLRKSVVTLKDVEFGETFIDISRFQGRGVIYDHVTIGRTFDQSKQNLVADIPHDTGFVVYKNGCHFARQNRDGEIYFGGFDPSSTVAEIGNIYIDNTCTFDGTYPTDMVRSSSAPALVVTGSMTGSVLTLSPPASFYVKPREAFNVSGTASNNGRYTVQSMVQSSDGLVSSITVEETFVTETPSPNFTLFGQNVWGNGIPVGDCIHFAVPFRANVRTGSGEIGASKFIGIERSLFGTSFAAKTTYEQGRWSFSGTEMSCEPFFINTSESLSEIARRQKYIIYTTNCKIQSRGLFSYEGGCYHIDVGSDIELTSANRNSPLINGGQRFAFVNKTGGSLKGRYIVNSAETILKDVLTPHQLVSGNVILFQNINVNNPNDNHLILMPPLDNDFNGTGLPLNDWEGVLPIIRWFTANASTSAPAPPNIKFRIFGGSQSYRYGSITGFSVPYTAESILGRDNEAPARTIGRYSGIYSEGDTFLDLATNKKLIVRTSELSTILIAGTAGVTSVVELIAAPTAGITFRWVGVYDAASQVYNYYKILSYLTPTQLNISPVSTVSWPVGARVTLVSVVPDVDERDAPYTFAGSTYSIQRKDVNNTIYMTSGSANTVRIGNETSDSIPVNSTIDVVQEGAGATTVDADISVILNGVPSTNVLIGARYKRMRLIKRTINSWVALDY